MAFSESLKIALQKEFHSFTKTQLIAASEELTRRYRNPKRDQEPIFITDATHRLAYLATRMPATFAVIQQVLEQIKAHIPHFLPKSLCDIGAGPGTACWAASELFESLTHLSLYEKDLGWIEIGRRLMQQSELQILKCANWYPCDLLKLFTMGSHDLMIVSYLIGELPLEQMESFIAPIWNSTNQILVLIEPGTPHGFERIRKIREWLIKNHAFIIAPCTHQETCPMPSGDWCHFIKRLERTPLHMNVKDVTLGYEDEKFSYIVASKNPFMRVIDSEEGRILRHPNHHSGHSNFTICKKSGIAQITVSRRQKGFYKACRKLNWGDLWRSPEIFSTEKEIHSEEDNQ